MYTPLLSLLKKQPAHPFPMTPASTTCLVVLPHSLLNAIWQVNKHHRGPPRLTATRDLGMPQTEPLGSDVWGVNEQPWWSPWWGCCLYIPVVGQMRRPCCKPAPPARAWDWNFSLIARVRRKWNFEVNLTILRSIFYYFWTRFESEQATVGQGNSSINGYIQDVKFRHSVFRHWQYPEKLWLLAQHFQKQRKSLESEIPFPKQDAPVGLKQQHCVNSLLSQLFKMSLLISPGWLIGWMNSDSITMTYRCKCSSGFNCSLSQFCAGWRAMETSLTDVSKVEW